jgi:hypothetical protein
MVREQLTICLLTCATALAPGCVQNATALETFDASIDAITYVEPDGGTLANLCAHPELFDGTEVEMTVTGIQRTPMNCTAVGCGSDGGAPACCNDCDAYWVLPCASGGQLAFIGGADGFRCFGNECALNCTPHLVPSDTLSFRATVHLGGVMGSCCAPVIIGTDALATFEIIDYTVTSLPDS